MIRSFLLAVLLCLGQVRGGAAASCSYPTQWAAEGLSFQPVRYFTNLPECEKATIFVHYPSRTQQVRSFTKTDNGSLIETGLWVFRSGLEGSSVNIPLFGRNNIKYDDYDKKIGKCDVMAFRTGDNKPMAGALEMHQHLTGLTPIKASDGSIKYYEKNFTDHQTMRISLKQHQYPGLGDRLESAINYLYSAFTHRVQINKKGECIPLHFQRVVYFGSSCHYHSYLGMLPTKTVPQIMEYYFVMNPKSYKPGAIGRFDREIPQLSCSNDFAKLNVAEMEVEKALASGKCTPDNVLTAFIDNCCKLSRTDFMKNPACDLTHTELLKRYSKSQIRQDVCERREAFELGQFNKIFNRDAECNINF